MAQVKFYGMLLDFQFVRSCYYNDAFSKFVFQPYMPNSAESQEEYYLLVYALDSNGDVMTQQDLVVVQDDIYDAPQRLDLGNITLTRLQLDPFMKGGDNYTNLYLSPREFGAYVAYYVTGTTTSGSGPQLRAAVENLLDVDLEIKPSPPAPPAP
jgi:hypothetical protein